MGILNDIGGILDFGTGLYGGITGGAEDWLSDPTGRKASERALAEQIAHSNRALDLQKDMYDQRREDLMPWYDVGKKNLNQLDRSMGNLTDTFSMEDFMTDPGYQFRLSEGEKAINRSMASKGLRNSTAAVKSLNDYNQGMASNEYQRAYDRFNQDRDQRYNKLANLAGLGQVQSNQLSNAAGQYGNNASAIEIGKGNAFAAQNMGMANFYRDVTGQGLDFASNMGGMMAMSDERTKTNIEPISKEDLKELSEAIKPYKFNYANDIFGEGDWVGVMAQDLEKTKLGKNLVETQENGLKMINMHKVGSLILATMGGGV